MQKLKNSLAAMLVLCPIICAMDPVLAQTGTPASAQAPDPARLAAARDLMRAEKTEELWGQIFSGTSNAGDGIVSQILEQIGDPAMRERVRKEIADSQKALQQEMMKQRGDLVEIVVAAYARSLTVEEMQAVAAFHRSPLGEKLLKTTLDANDARLEVVNLMMTGKPIPKPAVDPAKLKAVKEMMEVSGMTPNTLGSLFGEGGQPDNKFAEMMKQIYDWNIARLAGELTQEEIAGITSFYKTPHGSKFAKTVPQIMAEVSKATLEKLGGPDSQMPLLPGNSGPLGKTK
jgi:hypothetical protein